jgi:hypothetical protein
MTIRLTQTVILTDPVANPATAVSQYGYTAEPECAECPE